MVGQAALIACILLASSAETGENVDTSKPLTPPSWRIAPEVSHYRYKEPGVMKNEGTLYGVVGSYTFYDYGQNRSTRSASNSGNTVTLEGRLASGEMDYDGSDMYTNEPISMSGIDDFLLDLRMLWGRERPEAKWLNAVYIGAGYRYLNDDSSSLPGGYERKSNYLYVPLGSRKDFDLADRWSLSLRGEFDLLLIGRQISYLGDADPNEPTVRNWQWPGFGTVLSLDLRYLTRNVDFALSPFVRYWWLDDSSTSEGYYEPENNTFEYGLSFVVRF